MKTWLRLTLVTMCVGGGFTGFAITLQSLLSSRTSPPFSLLLFAVSLALFASVTGSGLIFVCNPLRIRPIVAALAVQIPWVSSPLIVYKFAAGFHAVVGIGIADGGKLQVGAESLFGSGWTVALLQVNPFNLGINVGAVAMLILLRKSIKTPLVRTTTLASSEPHSPPCMP